MNSLTLEVSSSVSRTRCAFGLLSAVLTLCAWTPANATPSITIGGTTPSYTEVGSVITVAPAITIANGTDYLGGSLQFAITSSTTTETLGLTTSATASTVNGEVSVVGSAVYLGNGTTADRIGSVDGTSNGLAGQPLKINFNTSAFTNASFEDGTSTGWDITDGRAITGTTLIGGYAVPADPTLAVNAARSATSPGDALSATMTYSHAISTNVLSGGANGTKSLSLALNGQVSSGYGTVHGPYAVSHSAFSLNAGDTITFWWSAVGASDAFDVFGYLLNVDTGATTILINATGSSGSATQAWTQVTQTIATAGNYKFVFLSGSFDYSGGQALGASLLIDNVEVVTSITSISDSVVQALARLVTYQDSSRGPAASRTITVSATAADATTASATTSVSIVRANDAPTLTGTTPLTYTWNSAATAISSALVVTDPDDTNLTAGSVSISSGFQTGDTLALTVDANTMGSLAASYDAATGALTLTGTATLAQYQAALRAVTFATANTTLTARTITFSVTDADAVGTGALSGTATVVITVSANAPAQPVVTGYAASTLTGTAEAGTTVKVYLDSTLLGSTTTASNGSWSYPVTATLTAGTHIFTATATNTVNLTSSASAGYPVTSTLITSVTAPAAGSYTTGDVLSFTVNYDSAVTVVTSGGAPRLALTVNGQTVYATYVSGSGTTALVFSYTAQAGDAGSGITVASTLELNGATISSANGTAAGLTFTAPNVAGITVTKLGQTITFDALASKVTTDATFTLTATASSGLPVTFTVVSGPALLSGSTVTLTGASGTVVIEAAQAGNTTYYPAPAVRRSFAVAAVGPQVYFGTSSASDTIAANIKQDNSGGTVLGYLSGVSGGFVFTFSLAADGTFSGTTSVLSGSNASSSSSRFANSYRGRTATAAATTTTLTIHGTVINGVLTGTIDELSLPFSASMQAQNGPTATVAGYYEAAATNTATGSIYSVVGTQSVSYALILTSSGVTSGSGTVDASGTLAITTSSGATLSGKVDAPSTTVSLALTVADAAPVDFSGLSTSTVRTDRLINLSSRAQSGPGEKVLITGFVIGGSTAKRVLLRGVGPALTSQGVKAPLANPSLKLFDANGALLYANDDWSDAATSESAASIGAFALPTGSKDAALIATLEPGTYTMHVADASGTTGVALAEIYDASVNPQADYQRLINISSRGLVGSGENALFGGFVVTGNSPKRVLIRGIGPALKAFGVTNYLSDPLVQVYQDGETVAKNDNWETPVTVITGQTSADAATITEAAASTGAVALASGSKDAALVVTLAPGAYTVSVSGVGSTTGVAMVEVYEIP